MVTCGCESWTVKKAEHWRTDAFWTVLLEKTLETPLDCKEIQPVSPKGNQSWIFTGRTDAEAETPILWPPEAKSWLIWKDPDAGKDWGQEKGAIEDERDGWHHRLNEHEFGWTLGVRYGQGGLACCGSWGHRESDMTEWLNCTEEEAVTDFIFLGSKITADGNCSHGIKRCLLLGRKAMTNLDSILNGRDISLPTKVHLVKAMVFPVVMYGCENWTIKKAEHWRIDAFEL